MKTEDKQSFVLIADLEQHINQKGLVKIGGQKKEVHFYPSGPLLEANFFGKIEWAENRRSDEQIKRVA